MIRFLKILLILFLLILLPKIAGSLTTSSYLIANAAISSFDYETAANSFYKGSFSDFDIAEQTKKIISLINSNRLEEAKLIVKQTIKLKNLKLNEKNYKNFLAKSSFIHAKTLH